MRQTMRIVAALVALLFLPALLAAQQVSNVTGVVTDKTGAVIPNVQVKLADTQTGAEQTTKTNEEGVYQFLKLRPGPGYALTFTIEGFRTYTVSNVYLGVGTTETINAVLEVGTIAETVEVKATGEATLNTTDATIGNVIDSRRVKDLPIQIRTSPARLLGLQPGVVANTGGGANRDGAVTGARTDQGNITVDGIDVNDMAGGFAFTTVGQAPIDAIQEFRTVSANPTATEGRSSGGQIALVTKSGSNDWHGSARFFQRNDKFAANSFFNNKAGTPKPKLHRTQFGGSFGGPILKDKLFFFSDYEGRRDSRGFSNSRTVPLDHVFQGQVAYINNGSGCTAQSNLANAPSCITIAPVSQVQSLDPQHIGADAALLTFLGGRYPHGQLGLGLGNQVNTGGVRFNSPVSLKDNIWTNRIDFKTSKHQVFGRFNIERFEQDRTDGPIQQFPGDQKTTNSQSRDWAFAIGDTWTITPNVLNVAIFGITKQVFAFNRTFRPSFPNSFTFGAGLSAPFTSLSSQGRDVPVPTIRDDLSYVRGKHNWQVGLAIKPIRQESQLTNDFNFITVGLGGFLSNLDSNFRPSDILVDANSVAVGQWDAMFTFLLGHFASASTQANYTVQGTPLPAGTGKNRDFRYYEYETYFQDTWRATNSLTLTYGVRWGYYSPPYEANGFQAINDVDFDQLWSTRLLNASLGVASNFSEPFLTYDLGGKANGKPGYYEPDRNNFAPRFSLAYNPSAKNRFLNRLLGDRKTVIRLGGAVVYDRVAGALTFIQDQVSYLFDNAQGHNLGAGGPAAALLNDPRFTSLTSLPPGLVPTLPNITKPFTPFVDSTGTPTGNATGEFNYTLPHNFRTPYSYAFDLSVQRELPGGFFAEVAYVGRLGRKLFAQGDAAQIIDFRDVTSGQLLTTGFNALEAQIQANTAPASITPQAWFENQMSAAIAFNYGFSQSTACSDAGALFGVAVPNCTRLARAFFRTLIGRGDLSDTVQGLYGNGFLFPNVGMSGQFSDNLYNGNFAASGYNGLLVSLRKRYTHNLQFDLNYTFSHSIDNQSSVVNTVIGGLVCDLRDLRVCRGNSDFDVTHIVNLNFIYDLPFGRGQTFLRDAPSWLDHVVGGWEVSGVYTWRTGFAFGTTTSSFPVGFSFDSPAVLVGGRSVLDGSIHTAGTGSSATIQFFADPTDALKVLRNPNGGEIGNRNNLRGPHFWNIDLAVLKNFKMPWKESHRLQLRWEMFNALNHPSFLEPNANINSGTFGQISGERSSPREMQFALRYDF